jgi:hypothetical protein
MNAVPNMQVAQLLLKALDLFRNRIQDMDRQKAPATPATPASTQPSCGETSQATLIELTRDSKNTAPVITGPRLTFSSGGQLGSVFIGSVRNLENEHRCSTLSEVYRSFEGTSAGALCAFLLTLGMSSMELLIFFQQVPEYVPDLSRLPTHFGMCSPQHFLGEMLVDALRIVGLHESVTFSQLFDKTGINLSCGLTIIGPMQREIDASAEFTPNWPVIPALLGSMAIPGLFDPVAIHTPTGTLYAIDGAVSNAFRYVPKSDDHLGLLICPPNTPPLENSLSGSVRGGGGGGFSPQSTNILNYLVLIMVQFFQYLSRGRTAQYEHSNVILLPCGPSICDSRARLDTFIAKPSAHDLANYIKIGEAATSAFFIKRRQA